MGSTHAVILQELGNWGR